MATLVPYTNCQLTTLIDGTDCLGDSRSTINKNFSALEVATCNLTAQSVTTNILLTGLSSQFLTLSSTVNTINQTLNVGNVGLKTTLGTLVSSLSVFNTSGSYIGYIPIYK